jgi:hypothetical protein
MRRPAVKCSFMERRRKKKNADSVNTTSMD